MTTVYALQSTDGDGDAAVDNVAEAIGGDGMLWARRPTRAEVETHILTGTAASVVADSLRFLPSRWPGDPAQRTVADSDGEGSVWELCEITLPEGAEVEVVEGRAYVRHCWIGDCGQQFGQPPAVARPGAGRP